MIDPITAVLAFAAVALGMTSVRQRIDWRYIGNCVSLGAEFIHEIRDNAEGITYLQFIRSVGKEQVHAWAKDHGYDRWLTLARDWHVSYHKSSYDGRPVYYLVWSGYEHVWVPE